MADEIKNNELDDEVLDSVSGGGWFSGYGGYKSGSQPAFHVGEHVIINKSYYVVVGISDVRYGATITSVSKCKNGSDQYTYSIKYDDGDTEDNIYESQMFEKIDGQWTQYTNVNY